MEKDLYSGLKAFQEVGGDLIERIKSMGVYNVFEPLAEEYGHDPEMFNQALFYLLNCYSKSSPFIILQGDWAEIKKKSAMDAGIDPEGVLYYDILDLKNINFTRAVRFYLDYQRDKVVKHLFMLKDLYEQMVNAAIENIADSNGVINWDQKKKNAEHASKLYNEISEWEQRVEMSMVELTKPISDFNEKVKKENKYTLRLEDNLKPEEE